MIHHMHTALCVYHSNLLLLSYLKNNNNTKRVTPAILWNNNCSALRGGKGKLTESLLE